MVPLSDHPPANGFNNSEVAREVARLRIALLNTDSPAASTNDAISSGLSVEMSYRDMAHLAGVTENTLRKRMAKTDRNPDAAELALAVRICAVHAGQALPLSELASRIGVHAEKALEGALANEATELCRVDRAADDGVYVTALPAAISDLRAFINRFYMREPNRFMVVLALRDLDPEAVRDALDEVDPTGDLGVLYPLDVLATKEEGNGELLLRVAAPSQAAAISIAEGPWNSILEKMGLDPRPLPLIDVVPPGNRRYSESPVLTAFFNEIMPTETVPPSTIEAYRAAYLGDSDEVTLVGRCLQAAARAVRRAAGNQREPQLVTSGGTAFSEGEIANQLVLSEKLERIQKPAVRALLMGAARLGPIPAGELGHFKAPGEKPHIVESVSPSPEDRQQMASLAGQAVSEAIAQGVLAVEDALKPVVAP